MRYISTRGDAPALSFEEATLTGLAGDGGLYLPAAWPALDDDDDTGELRGLDYPQLAARIVGAFAGDCIPADDLTRLCRQSYKNFSHAKTAPLTQLDESLYLMELFHGPTLAFKDFALQLLGRLFEYFLQRRGETRTIIGATSGDTGSAAIQAVRSLDAVTLFMLHPRGRVSAVQRKQMTTVLDANIHNLSVDGDFDDCQNIVKTLFNDAAFRQRYSLAAVNSINWARIAAQTVYYFYAALQLGAKKINFAVPTGNFGNVFAGWSARAMGLPVKRLIIGSNRNDIVTRFFASGTMSKRTVAATISPSMDIQIASNFERYLFELIDRDGGQVKKFMQQFAADGEFTVTAGAHDKARELFFAHRLTDDETRAEIKRVYEKNGVLLDPHSAIGVAAARAYRNTAGDDTPTVALATAHPAKFPDAAAVAAGVTPTPPASLTAVMQREERVQPVANDAAAVMAVIDAAGGA